MKAFCGPSISADQPLLWIGVVIVDEAHLSRLPTSYLFKLVLTKIPPAMRPVLWLLSGTPGEQSPVDLKAFLDHFRAQWDLEGADSVLDKRAIAPTLSFEIEGLNMIQEKLDSLRKLFKTKFEMSRYDSAANAVRNRLLTVILPWAALLGRISICRTEKTPSFAKTADKKAGYRLFHFLARTRRSLTFRCH